MYRIFHKVWAGHRYFPETMNHGVVIKSFSETLNFGMVIRYFTEALKFRHTRSLGSSSETLKYESRNDLLGVVNRMSQQNTKMFNI